MRTLLYLFLLIIFITKTENAQIKTSSQSSIILQEHNSDFDDNNYKNFSIGLSGYYYSTSDIGSVIGIGTKIIFQLSEKHSIGTILKIGKGMSGYGATDYKLEIKDNIESLYEFSCLYTYNISEISNGLFVGVNLSYIWGKKEWSVKYSFIGLPIILGYKIILNKSLSLDIEIFNNAIIKTTYWGFETSFYIKL